MNARLFVNAATIDPSGDGFVGQDEGTNRSLTIEFLVINDEEAPTGRPAGELGWAGLANLFYWTVLFLIAFAKAVSLAVIALASTACS